MTDSPRRVLVVCTGNSCRSVMGEALINQLGKGRYVAFSAGSKPLGRINPGAIETLRRHGFDPGEPVSQSWDEYADQPFDLVITVCDSAGAETCPAFPGQYERKHWSTPDPSHVEGTEAEKIAAFDEAFAMLRRRVESELL